MTCNYMIFFQTKFLEKNNDALHFSLEALVQDSKNTLVKTLFEAGQGNGNGKAKSGKLTFISVGSKFRSQLSTLLEKLRSTVSIHPY